MRYGRKNSTPLWTHCVYIQTHNLYITIIFQICTHRNVGEQFPLPDNMLHTCYITCNQTMVLRQRCSLQLYCYYNTLIYNINDNFCKPQVCLLAKSPLIYITNNKGAITFNHTEAFCTHGLWTISRESGQDNVSILSFTHAAHIGGEFLCKVFLHVGNTPGDLGKRWCSLGRRFQTHPDFVTEFYL